MNTLALNDGLLLLIEPDSKNLRLVVTDGTTELGCRKVTPGKLNSFLSSAENSLFKGRLQLHKNEDLITVVFKDNAIGIVDISTLKKALNALS